MGSDKADSEDEMDDFEAQYLQTFYNRINQNREYFYEELLAENKIDKKKQKLKKQLKSPSLKSQEPKEPISSREIQLETQLLTDDKNKKKKNNEWTPKLEYINRKREFMSYEILSNVTFNIP